MGIQIKLLEYTIKKLDNSGEKIVDNIVDNIADNIGMLSELHYENAQKELEIIEVLTQPSDIAEAYRAAAAEMKAAGDFCDAPILAQKYLKIGAQIEAEGKERLYEKACERMNTSKSVVERKLAIDMFQRIAGYKDADKLALECEKKNLEKIEKKSFKNIISVVLVSVVIILISLIASSPNGKYLQAESLMAQEKYSEAQTIYKELGKYKDSVEKVTICQEKAEEKKRENALKKLGDVTLGKEMTFGPYTWRVLEKSDDELVLLATHSDKYEELTEVPYHDKDEAVTWADCSLREWLNGTFLDSFTEEEKERIILTELENSDNAVYHTDGGDNTQDYVYLLSLEEARQYSDKLASLSLNWLLRSPGNAENTVAYVSSDHAVMEYGCPVNWDKFDIRPVIRVSIKE